jgi:hypothetical protein
VSVSIVDKHTARAIVSSVGVDLGTPSEVEVTLDERRVPYITASLRFPIPDAVIRDLLDLRENDLRLDLRLRRDFGRAWALAQLTEAGGASVAGLTGLLAGGPLANITHLLYRPWNSFGERASQRLDCRLVITSRRFDDRARELAVEAASLEKLLELDVGAIDWDPGTTDLPTIVQLVLERYDAPLSTSSPATVAEADATLWKAGTTAGLYLDPMLEAASLRLWADEMGAFHLTQREQTVPGAVTLSPRRLLEHEDEMTLTGDIDGWVDAVVVVYTWTDELDLNRREIDAAGAQPARAGVTLTRTGVRYPGPGAAAGILNRAQGRGRVLGLAAVADYTARPGMAAAITPPVGDTQTGYVSSITYQLPAAEMRVGTRGLVDTPETAYLFGPPGFSYLDVPVGVDYLEFEWS